MPIVVPPTTGVATARQIHIYNVHRSACATLGIAQGTLQHKSLQGTLGTASATGNVIYTPPDPTTTGPVVSTTLVWLVTKPMPKGQNSPGESTVIGREGLPELIGQIPAIDDSQNLIVIAHDDLMIDMTGVTYRLLSPVITPDDSLWSFGLIKER